MIDENGVPAEQVLDEVRQLRAGDRPVHGGRLFAYVYDPGVGGLTRWPARRMRRVRM